MMGISINARRAFAAAAVAGVCVALPLQARSQGYLTDQRGAEVRSGSGLCWRTSAWTPAMANERCDPDLVPRKAAPAVAGKPAPAPYAPPPAPKPGSAPVAQKVTLAADALFDFDKAVIKPAGKASLDDLYAKLKGLNLETVIAVGHTDRLGSDSYNMKLSVRRADAVKAYLVSKGVPANRIYTEGKGRKVPVTKPGDCKGRKSPKLIACLQPDRRVEIEVLGTRAR